MSDRLMEKPVPVSDGSGEQSSEDDGQASEELKIVILGKTGSGKSSVGNTLLNKNCFTPKCSPVAGTGEVKTANGKVGRRNVTIIDTPGIFDPNRSEKDLRSEIMSCLTECAPGPHVFLLVFPVERFTPESIDTVKKIQGWFGKDALKHTVVLFTHGDNLDDHMTIQQFLDLDKSDEKSRAGFLKSFVESCGNRVHVIDNKYWKSGEDNRNNSLHIKQLMKTIDVMVKENGGKHYTNKNLEILARAIEAEVENIKTEWEEAGKTENMSEIKQQARDRVKKKALRKLAGIGTGALLGALLGVALGVSVPVILLAGLCVAGVTKKAMEVKSSKSDTAGGMSAIGAAAAGLTVEGAAAAGAAAAGAAVAAAEGAVAAAVASVGLGVAAGVFAAVGAVGGGVKGAEAAKKSDNATEAAGKAVQSVLGGAKKIFKGAWKAPQKLVKPKQPQCQPVVEKECEGEET